MAIDSWTSEGMDWSSADALRMKPLYPYLEAIRLAIIERKKALGQELTGFFAENYEIRLNTIYDYYTAVQNEISVLINQYCVINYPNPSFPGRLTIGVGYSAFLWAIDAPARIDLAKLNCLNLPNWMYQQYRLINAMKYRNTYNTSAAEGGFQKFGKAEDHYSTAEAKRLAIEAYETDEPDVYAYDRPYSIEGWWDQIGTIAASYHIITRSCRLRLHFKNIPAGQTFIPSLYVFASKSTSGDGWYTAFDPCGLNLVENAYSKVFEGSSVTLSSSDIYITLEPTRPTLKPPAPPPSVDVPDPDWDIYDHQSETGAVCDAPTSIYDCTPSFRFHA
jgi:hypothetical protein